MAQESATIYGALNSYLTSTGIKTVKELFGNDELGKPSTGGLPVGFRASASVCGLGRISYLI
jgi:hypothetical protein